MLIMKKTLFPAVFILLLCGRSAFSEIGHPPGMLGVAVDEVLTSHVKDLSLPGEYGARVTNVGPGSPAEQVGMQSADVVVSYNGIRVESARAFQRMVLETPAGRQVELRVIRNGTATLLQPVLGEGRMPTSVPTQARRSLGVWIESIAPAVGQYLGLEDGVGVIVREVQEGSPAAAAGIQAKDVLIQIGDQQITDPETVSQTLETLYVPLAAFTLIRGTEVIDLNVRF